jgi:hypothetical protein
MFNQLALTAKKLLGWVKSPPSPAATSDARSSGTSPEEEFRNELSHTAKIQVEKLKEARRNIERYYGSCPSSAQEIGSTLPQQADALSGINVTSTNPRDIELYYIDQMIENFYRYLTPTTPEEYADFLEKHFERGGVCTDYFSGSLKSYGEMFTARRDMLLPRGYGSWSLEILVPHGIHVVEPEGDDSHNNVYFMDTPPYDQKERHFGFFIPLYKDVAQILEQRGVTIACTARDWLRKHPQATRPLPHGAKKPALDVK